MMARFSLHSRLAHLIPRVRVPDLGRRLAYFWMVWPILLLTHEAGHAFMARRAGLTVPRLTLGIGPVVWRGRQEETELELRLVPLLGLDRKSVV